MHYVYTDDRHGFPSAPRSLPVRRRLSPPERAEAIRQLKAGGAVASVAEALGLADGAVRAIRDGGIRTDEATTTAGQVVSCRLSPEELRVFDGLCSQMGARSRSDGLRSIIRMSGGFLEFSRADSDALEGIHAELHKIGVNVNQVAHAANRGRVDLVKGQWAALNDLRRALPGVRKLVLQIIRERRRRGVELFRAQVAAAAGREDARDG